MLSLEPTGVGGGREKKYFYSFEAQENTTFLSVAKEVLPLAFWGIISSPLVKFSVFHLWDKNLFRAHWSWLHSTVPISMPPSVPKCSNGLRLVYYFFFPMFPSFFNGSKIIEVITGNRTCHRFRQKMKWWLKATFGLECRESLTQTQKRSKVLFGFRA